MQVILAESAGFCYGVKRAVELAQKTAEETQGCWMLGDLIHNTHVVNDLAARGVRKTDRPEALGAGDTVVIRSHGELKSVLDGLAARGVRCVNATCPNVVHIQELVSQAEQEGRQVVIIGEPHHPEVMGLASWCVHPLVFQGPEAVAEWVKNGDFQPEMPVSIVAQTTCIRELFESSCKILKKECTNVKIFDTICYATRKRQNEAAEIAAQVDVMVVVGDRKSANTKHLAEICRQNCSHVLSIEGADELSATDFAGCRVAGLTAGASTPAGIIKEVKTTMSEEIKSTETMEESFEELLNQSFKTLNTGEKVTGIVTAITPTEVQVDVGAKQYAYIKLSELSDDPSAKPEDIVKVGDEVETYVVRVNDVEGYAELSKKRLDAVKIWENIETAVEEKTVLEGTVTEENKGGIVVSVKGIRVFVPASQSGQPRGADLSAMKGQKVQLRITEVNRARRRVVGSIRSVTDEARKAAQEAVWSTIEVGKHYTGTVKSMTSYGVFVDIGGVDGMVHISQIADRRIEKPEDVVKVGDEIETYIIRVNDVEGYAMLSKKRLDAVKVWEDIEKAREDKTTLEGKVTEENKGGIVVNVKGVRVFVPASQSGLPRGAELSTMIGQTVSLRITEVNRARRRVVGSIKAVTYEARQAAQAEIWNNIEVGKRYTGTVKSMTSYGVFVDIGGVDGMVHISELSWSRIKNPAEVVSVGDTLEVYVISFDPEKHKISLGVKDRSMNPWDKFMATYHVGDVANVRIVKLMTFGAFAEVVPGVDGLIHISQIADRRIEKPGDVLTEGEMVDAKITAIDEEKQKISLSIRALLTPADEGEDEE